ncbi:MAG TPA: FAD-binding and (Fe-S)-binding domain-containing protein [Kutzneria sp.]
MELAVELGRTVKGEVRFDAGSRATYSTDASNYRQVPIGVVVPKTVEDAVRAIRVCHEAGVPVLSRGGGTSLAGQCCNEAVVLDWSKYCTRLVSVDVAAKTCVVEPGIALDVLNDQLASHQLMVGPKPSTHVSCTIGGMIGNNSCGSTAQAYGKMVDSVVRLEILTHDGCRAWVGETDDETYERIVAEGGRLAELYRGLRELRDTYLADIRTRYPKIPRRVSGYNLDSLLPESGFNLAKALVGSESTLVTVLRAEIQLVDVLPARTLVVLGFPDITAAADCVPEVLPHEPVALEGVDEQLVQLEHSEHLAAQAIKQLPKGSGWLMVQFAGTDQEEVDRRAKALCDDLHRKPNAPDVAFLDDPKREEELWQAREAGLGATAYPPQGPETHEGWEDAAVPPEKLGDYLREFRGLLERFEYENASLYGHFGQGCIHTRIPFDLKTADGIAKYRRFAKESAELVVSFGGSLSGEHGDGQSRGELLPLMFGARLVEAFGQVKALFDPDGLMNPGKVVHPHRLDENLRQGSDYRPWEPATHFAYPEDDNRFAKAAARCVGVGKCRGHESGVMCPSYRATREEEHSTRGRARLLFEMLNGEVIQDGWRSEAVHDALDLCLACKGCQSDCPVNVDMATYKAEFLSHHFEGRLRPLSHYSMGWLPLWARLAAFAPSLVNSVSNLRPVKALGGIARQREVPFFARRRLVKRLAGRTSPAGQRGKVLLWPDTFTNNFHPAIGEAAVQVLEAAGFEVVTPDRTVCCGLTWISTGQLATAERVARRTLETLKPQLRDGTPIVVLEPSCAAVFRDDLPKLLHGDQDAHRLAHQTKTLAEILTERAPDWRPPTVGRQAVAQPHCHHHAVLGFDTDEKLMRQYGIDVDVLDAGCCGLAGNFGFEQGHYDVSMACAEDKLLPSLRQAGEATLVLADGFSCRTQIDQSDVNQRPMHLAEVLAAALHGTQPRPERPSAPGRAARTVAAAAAVAAATAVPALAWLYRRRSR